ncbi:MAG: hypothetical protein Kow0098_14560 [Ignavibacteriaceae bacterium]
MQDLNGKNIKYSVIIPAVNEEYYLHSCIKSILKEFPGAEIIVVDGGSTDNTAGIAEKLGAVVLKSVPNRGIQMNLGATASSGDVLIFLHADSVLTAGCGQETNLFFADFTNNAAMFNIRFDIENYLLIFFSSLTRINSVFTKFGDSGLIIRKSVFSDCNMFPEWQVFEDVYFLKKLRKKTDVKIFNSTLITSSRRFITTGVLKNQLLNIRLYIKYLTGKSIPEIAGKYQSLKYRFTDAVIVFAKYPQPGKVKTRLAKDTDNSFALKFYKLCAENTFSVCRKLPDKNLVRIIFYPDEKYRRAVMKWGGRKFFISPQNGDSLGERMSSAFRLLFGARFRKVIIIGTDNPALNVDILNNAFQVLDEKDIVIGPSNDGGYYLLGMTKFYQQLFDNIQWSSESVMRRTLVKISDLGLSVGVLNTLTDIDTIEDIKEIISSDSEKIPQRLLMLMKSVV